MSAARVIVPVLVVAGVIAVLQLYRTETDAPATNVKTTAENPLPPDSVAATRSELPALEQGGTTAGVAECLTMAQVREQPAVRQLLSQLDAAAARGADIEIFRGLDEAEILAYAEQGDSAAMIVTAASLVMQAYGSSSTRAIDWLTNDGHLDDVDTDQQVSPNAGLALNDAAYWFYEAALHGRLLALQHYGEIRSQLFGGPVGLGWISQEEYDLLAVQQKEEISPANMYRRAALEMIPGANAGIIQGESGLSPTSESADVIRNDILHEFNMALADSGLPQPATTAGDAGTIERLWLQACAPE